MPGIQHMLVNPFLQATRRSTSRALTIGTFTDAALSAPGKPAGIVAIYDAYHPAFDAYFTAAGKRSATSGQKVGSVYGFQERMASLSKHIKKWGHTIEGVHSKGTAEYEVFFPRGRKAFRNGSRTARMAALASLANALAADPALSALHTEVAAFKADLEAALLATEGKKGLARGSSVQLERARIALCEALYAALGALIALYPDRPQVVADYFDTATMHRKFHRKRKGQAAESVEAQETEA